MTIFYESFWDMSINFEVRQNINKDNNPTTWPHMLEIVNGNPNPNYFWSTVN